MAWGAAYTLWGEEMGRAAGHTGLSYVGGRWVMRVWRGEDMEGGGRGRGEDMEDREQKWKSVLAGILGVRTQKV